MVVSGLLARMQSRVRCAYPSADPVGAEDWFECDLPLGHAGEHEAYGMWWPTRREDQGVAVRREVVAVRLVCFGPYPGRRVVLACGHTLRSEGQGYGLGDLVPCPECELR